MDENNFTGRLKRYTQVSTAVGGFALKLAGEKVFGLSINRENHALDMGAILGNLKGPVMKIAQFLATVPGALPPEYAQELLKLQSNAPPMGWSFVRRRMSHELGPNWLSLFKTFEKEASASASLGQVHQAVSLEGSRLACKLQYPDMESVIQADINHLKLLLSLYEKWGKALETKSVQEEIAARLKEELDYKNEACNIKLYHSIFAGHSFVQVPTVRDDLSTNRLLTMEWMDGDSILSFKNADQLTRNDLGVKLFHTWYTPFYKHCVIHADPHPGNYKISENGHINLLDFGCIRRFPSSFVQGVIDLYTALKTNDKDLAVHAYSQWGFKNLSQDLIHAITEWAKLLYEPLLDNRVRPIQLTSDGQVGWDTATKVHAELERLGGISPPREFVFMDRAAVGVGAVLMQLGAEHNWHQTFEELIEGFNSNDHP